MDISRKYRFRRWSVLLAVSFITVNSLAQAPAAPLPGSALVTHVIDGDSLLARFADGQSRGVRLIGINAPELTDDRQDVRVWAFLAKRFAVHHLQGKKVRLEYDWDTRDKHGRVLAYVRPEGGELFNELIVRRGFAYVFLLYPFRKDYQEAFRNAQREAVWQGKGLWGKEPPPEISLSEVQSHLGEYVTVHFACAQAGEGERYVFLSPKKRELQVLIWKEPGTETPRAGQFKKKTVFASGLLEKGAKQPQLYVLFHRRMIRIE